LGASSRAVGGLGRTRRPRGPRPSCAHDAIRASPHAVNALRCLDPFARYGTGMDGSANHRASFDRRTETHSIAATVASTCKALDMSRGGPAPRGASRVRPPAPFGWSSLDLVYSRSLTPFDIVGVSARRLQNRWRRPRDLTSAMTFFGNTKAAVGAPSVVSSCAGCPGTESSLSSRRGAPRLTHRRRLEPSRRTRQHVLGSALWLALEGSDLPCGVPVSLDARCDGPTSANSRSATSTRAPLVLDDVVGFRHSHPRGDRLIHGQDDSLRRPVAVGGPPLMFLSLPFEGGRARACLPNRESSQDRLRCVRVTVCTP